MGVGGREQLGEPSTSSSSAFLARVERALGRKVSPEQITEIDGKPFLRESEKVLEFGREYSEDPLAKYLIQKPFDAVLKKSSNPEQPLARHKANRLVDNLRKVYEQRNFEERDAILPKYD